MQHTLSSLMKTIITLMITALFLIGCSTSTIIGSWSDPGLTKGSVQNVLVIGVAKDDMIKRTYEDTMVIRLKEKGVLATPAYPLMKQGEKLERDAIVAYIQKNNIDSVMVTQMIDKRTETVVTPAQTSVRTGGYNSYRGGYGGYYPHYSASYNVISTPTTIQNYEVLTIEATLYKVEDAQEKPVWSAQSETAPGGNINSDLSELVDKLIKDMSSKGVF